MPRNREDARRRLRQAALELFSERGYDATTTAEIAAYAGVTERTFFRHFADKREALFDGEEAFRDALVEGVMAAPEGLTPPEILLSAFRSVEPMLQENRGFSEPRQKVIAQTPALQERVLTKTAVLIGALAAALRRRGVADGTATLAAQIGMTVFSYAASTWFEDPTGGMAAHLSNAVNEMNLLWSPPSPQ